MPNQPKTPAASFRLGEDLIGRTKARAERDGVTATEVVRAALEQYLKDVDKV